MFIDSEPFIGAPIQNNVILTAKALSNFAIKKFNLDKCNCNIYRYLDVGCGNGFITYFVANSIRANEIIGIDIQKKGLEEFKLSVKEDPRYKIFEMSSDNITYPDGYFNYVTSYEVLEHVKDLSLTVNEIVRVLAINGILVISVPHVWFPFETHGIHIGSKSYGYRIPFLPYIKPLHRKYSLARVFSSKELDSLFIPRGMKLLDTAYVAPKFERFATNKKSWESKVAFLRNFLEKCEKVPIIKLFVGVSILKAYIKL